MHSRSFRLSAAGLLLLLGACVAPPADETPGITGFSAASAARQMEAEARLSSHLDRASVDAHYRELTRLPHPAGSERTREVAEMIADRFREYGLEEVQLHRYDVLLPWPREVSVEMTSPVSYVAELREDAYEIDPDTALDAGPTYLGMTASGDITAELIYAHSGNPEDYDWLESQGIDPRGKVAIVRYSVPYSYRGFKAWEAERRGVAALLIYSDPQEDGFLKGEVFPDGPWGPESHIQRGAITYDFIVPGDPLTPGWASTEGAERIPVEAARSVPAIVAVPMSWRDAKPLLENIGGPEVPEGWRGGLPITYRAGGAGAQVHVKVDMDEGIRPMWVPEGRIIGSEFPDELVVVGNHHDAWVFGGVDPSSGTATMLELAKALGAEAQAGNRPRRTIVFGSWDGEEWHLTGSTEWGEAMSEELSANAVAYLNVDSSTSGADFGASAVASLNRLVIETVRDVDDPGREGSVLDAWRAQEAGEASIDDMSQVVTSEDINRVANELGSGSDYTVFLNFLGMPVVSMGFDGPYGVYHSIYDNYWRMTNIADPGLRYMTTMAEVWGRMALRLANADVLPVDLELYAQRVGGFVDKLEMLDGVAGELDLANVRILLARWESLGADINAGMASVLAGEVDPAGLQQANRQLLLAERQLLLPARADEEGSQAEGIPGRPWFKHGLYAPRYTYAAMSLPGITEAAEQGDWDRAREELGRLEQTFQGVIEVAQRALAALQP